MKLKFDHINMSVSNLKESMEWYQKIFGMEFLEGDIKHASEPWAIVGKDDTMLCLYEEKDNKSAQDVVGPYHRIYHFGLRISDDKEWEAKIKEHNLKPLYGGAYKYPRSVSWYIIDPSGHEIEVNYCGDGPLKF